MGIFRVCYKSAGGGEWGVVRYDLKMDGFHPHFCFDVFVGGIWSFLKIGDVWSLEFPPFFWFGKGQ